MANGLRHYHDSEYFRLVDFILKNGILKPNRTGVDTLSVAGYQLRFDISDGSIPLLTSKKVHMKSIVHELLWMISGSTNIKYLNDNGVTIWDEWADENGDLGPVYGSQWRHWPTFGYTFTEQNGKAGNGWIDLYKQQSGIDQLADVIERLKKNPNDRRLLVSAWNPSELSKMKLPPCHYAFQFWHGDGKLSVIVNQRSCDVGLGVPFNIVQYSLLLRMIAQVTDLEASEVIWNGGDTHIYVNHIDALKEQLTRDLRPSPYLRIARDVANIDDFRYSDFIVEEYDPHPSIKMTVAV